METGSDIEIFIDFGSWLWENNLVVSMFMVNMEDRQILTAFIARQLYKM